MAKQVYDIKKMEVHTTACNQQLKNLVKTSLTQRKPSFLGKVVAVYFNKFTPSVF